jgi:hypothetical protein
MAPASSVYWNDLFVACDELCTANCNLDSRHACSAVALETLIGQIDELNGDVM